jgi:hypothetical protein
MAKRSSRRRQSERHCELDALLPVLVAADFAARVALVEDLDGGLAAQAGVEPIQPPRGADTGHDHHGQEQEQKQPMELCGPRGQIGRHASLRPPAAVA